MDLTARVVALEEDTSLLKGEIKTILQELRTAVLAQENPFAPNGLNLSAAVAARVEAPAAAPAEQTPQEASSVSSDNVVRLNEATSPAQLQAGSGAVPRPYSTAAFATPESFADEYSKARRWSVHSLAALMAWTRESAQRYNANDLGLILALARYGHLIDNDLENTLTNLAEVFAPAEAPATASSTDFLLALRELDALLDEANKATEPGLRRAG